MQRQRASPPLWGTPPLWNGGPIRVRHVGVLAFAHRPHVRQRDQRWRRHAVRVSLRHGRKMVIVEPRLIWKIVARGREARLLPLWRQMREGGVRGVLYDVEGRRL